MEAQGGKYLTFALSNETYGIPLQKAKEIIGMLDITHIPKTQGYIKGVVNLRGKIIPIRDLRLKFGMDEIENLCRLGNQGTLEADKIILEIMLKKVNC